MTVRTRRWMFAWTWCVAAVLLTNCASAPQKAPPFEPRPNPETRQAALGVAVTDRDTGAPVAAATVTLHTGETATTDAAGYVVFPDLILGGRGITVSADGYVDAGSQADPFLSNTHVLVPLAPRPPPAPAIAVTARPLVGPLRVQDKLLRDDTGYRRVLFCSWFPALRVLRDNPAEFTRQLDAIAAAGYQGVRVFLAVGGWEGFWDGREVVPITFQKWHFDHHDGGHHRPPTGREHDGRVLAAWPDYDDLYRTLLRAFKARGLRLEVTTGDMQIIVGNDQAKELDLHRRLARIAAEEGGANVIALVEGTNEVPINRYGGAGDASIEQLGRILQIWRAAIPGVLTAQGAFLSEEPEHLFASVRYGQVAAVHVSREPIERHIKRSHALVHWEGRWRFFPVPFWQTEPAGPGEDSYAAVNDPANLTAIYSMHALTGQGSTYFNGPAVRAREPLESTWGFRELPALLAAHLPEDVATWSREVNAPVHGVMYWTRGREFRTVLFETWNPAPPRPLEQWTLYAGDRVTRGTGAPPAGTGLLVGTFR